MISFLLVLLTNLWIWKILSENIILGVFLMLVTVAVYKNINQKRTSFLFVTAIVLIIIQLLNTKVNLNFKSTDYERHIQIQRTREYPFIPFPLAHWLEERKETMIFYKLERNFSEVVDPNLYFFANHPRERAAVREFEKYPYLLFPLFLIGILYFYQKNPTIFVVVSGIPLITLTLVGNSSWAGPLSFFPFITIAISLGLEKLLEKIRLNKKLSVILLILYILVLIQTISYEIY
ncbi:hypothetical protein HY045_01290 [Candidatus Woesebacteria bacterium]|nr:hypothetical protein [Candidatus Woesebacteria bacterium]